MNDVDFEELRSELKQLALPDGHTRYMRWLAIPLAIGRTGTGDYEVFIRGSALNARSALVRRHIQHGDWQPKEGGESFPANRIVLPSAPHFASIAALIAIELLRAGVDAHAGPNQAFLDVEPIIEMAIRRGALPENVIIGLIGELTVLRQLILSRRDRPATLLRALDFWQGWQDGGRDFRIGDHSIKVKTTQAGSPIHEFSGLHQLEAGALPTGNREHLYLLSVGLASSTTIGETLPVLVDSINGLLSGATDHEGLEDEFVRRVSLYGNQSGGGYVHSKMADWSAYSTRYSHTYPPRLYRVDDPAMKLLDRQRLMETFVQPQGLSFTLHIPEQVSPFNPAPNWEFELNMMDGLAAAESKSQASPRRVSRSTSPQ